MMEHLILNALMMLSPLQKILQLLMVNSILRLKMVMIVKLLIPLRVVQKASNFQIMPLDVKLKYLEENSI